MNFKRFDTLSWKIVGFSLTSLALTAAILLVGYYGTSLLIWLNPSRSFWGVKLLRWVINNIGSTPIVILMGIPLFIFFILKLSRNTTSNLHNISSGVQAIADGNLSFKVPVTGTDELGKLAENMNLMAGKLKSAIEEERAAAKAKNDLITDVSHDLRTPLTSVLGFLEYVENDRYKNEVELRYYVNIAYEKSLALKKLIDDLFEYTRVSSSGLPLNLKPVDLGKLLEQLVEEFAPVLKQADMSYRIHTDKDPLIIHGDADELVRLYENLFTNAVRYGKEGKILDISVYRTDDRVIATCTNYGNPIPATDLPHLFKRFYRVDKSRSRETGGSGLGLAIAKSITELHGGMISAKSSRKQTEFETSFPASE
ncbi:sensor histidine kinase [Paenibacillus etheri]|uniref:histidine kinase n=1 Tax=Paenibacillus etheri TaxID=1306852 RepID=A0A0W1B0I1_9BACL|nr:HAMP domain-containing sensor histidine kinase [Paenibacillus etheri]KTD87116.1 histidine kinase [Paenibacillus etheri]